MLGNEKEKGGMPQSSMVPTFGSLPPAHLHPLDRSILENSQLGSGVGHFYVLDAHSLLRSGLGL